MAFLLEPGSVAGLTVLAGSPGLIRATVRVGPAQVAARARSRILPWVQDLALLPDHILVVSPLGLQTLDMETLDPLDFRPLPGAQAVAMGPDALCVAATWPDAGIACSSLAEAPADPGLIHTTTRPTRDLAALGRRFFAAQGTSGLGIYEWDGQALISAGRVDVGCVVHRVAAGAGLVAAACLDGRVRVYPAVDQSAGPVADLDFGAVAAGLTVDRRGVTVQFGRKGPMWKALCALGLACRPSRRIERRALSGDLVARYRARQVSPVLDWFAGPHLVRRKWKSVVTVRLQGGQS